MKISYAFVGGFLVWCLVASQWYLVGVKGVSTDASNFNATESLWAIVEILTMLLVATLIGFGIAWFVQQASLDEREKERAALALSHYHELVNQFTQSKERLQGADAKLKRAQEIFSSDYKRLNSQNEKLKLEMTTEKKRLLDVVEELHKTRPKLQLAEVEHGRLHLLVKQLEHQLAESRQQHLRLVAELEEARTVKVQERNVVAPEQLVQKTIAEKDRDNLKMISGIGPVIEQKLNSVGIYTFRQISEFTPQIIDYVTSTIKFFPDRIGRDNWIGQAAALARHRK